MKPIPRIQAFNYACLRDADAARCYGLLLGVYARITLGLLLPSVRAFGMAHDAFLARHRLLAGSRAADSLRAPEVRRERLLDGLSDIVAAGRADPDPAVKSAAGRASRILRACGAPSPLAPDCDARTRAIAEALARLRSASLAPSLARLPSCRDAVRDLAEANAAYARLYDECAASSGAGEAGATARLRAEVDGDAHAMALKVNSCIDILGDRSLGRVAAAANAVLDGTRQSVTSRGGHYEEPAAGGDEGEPGLVSALARPRVRNRRIRERSGGGGENAAAE